MSKTISSQIEENVISKRDFVIRLSRAAYNVASQGKNYQGPGSAEDFLKEARDALSILTKVVNEANVPDSSKASYRIHLRMAEDTLEAREDIVKEMSKK